MARDADEALRRSIVRSLERRHVLAADKHHTRFGMPAVRGLDEALSPERLVDATPYQKRLVTLSYAVPWPGPNACALWVEQVYGRMGIGYVSGDAGELCRRWCTYSDIGMLKVGMAVAVEHHPFDAWGLSVGHIGLYIGDGIVRDSAGEGLRSVPLSAWLSIYGAMEDPRWGWLGAMALDRMQPEL